MIANTSSLLLELGSPQVSIQRNNARMLFGTWQEGKLLLAFEKTSGVTGEVLFNLSSSQKEFMLEGYGNLKIGHTAIHECQIVLAPHGVMLRKNYDLAPGRSLDVQFTLAEKETMWKGEAVFYEEIKCELLKSQQVITSFHFMLPHNDSMVHCEAKQSLPGLHINLSLEEHFPELCAEALNGSLQKLRQQLMEKLWEELQAAEQQFSAIQLDGGGEGYLPPNYQPPKNKRPAQQPGNNQNALPANPVNGYLRGYVQQPQSHRKQQLPVNHPFSGNNRNGYLPGSKPAAGSMKGYLARAPQQASYQPASGYLQKKHFREEKPAYNGQRTVQPVQVNNAPLQGLALNYAAIEKYATQVLYLKGMLRGLQSNIANAS